MDEIKRIHYDADVLTVEDSGLDKQDDGVQGTEAAGDK